MNYLKNGILILALSQANLNALENGTEATPIITSPEQADRIARTKAYLLDLDESQAPAPSRFRTAAFTALATSRRSPSEQVPSPSEGSTSGSFSSRASRTQTDAEYKAQKAKEDALVYKIDADEERKARTQLPTEIAVKRARERAIKAKDPALDSLLRSPKAASRAAVEQAERRKDASDVFAAVEKRAARTSRATSPDNIRSGTRPHAGSSH